MQATLVFMVHQKTQDGDLTDDQVPTWMMIPFMH